MKLKLLALISVIAFLLTGPEGRADSTSGLPSGIERDNLHGVRLLRVTVATPPDWAANIGLTKEVLMSYIKGKLIDAGLTISNEVQAGGGTLTFVISGTVVHGTGDSTAFIFSSDLALLQRVRLSSDNRLSLANTWNYEKLGINSTGAKAATSIWDMLDKLTAQFISDYQSANIK
jgi:hypothetical protein